MIVYTNQTKEDLFNLEDNFALGVNFDGEMDKGIALEFRNRWPDFYKCYNKFCKEHDRIGAGDTYAYPIPGPTPGTNRWLVCLGIADRGSNEVKAEYLKACVTGTTLSLRTISQKSMIFPGICDDFKCDLSWEEIKELFETADTDGMTFTVKENSPQKP
jgi:hypothetical protein